MDGRTRHILDRHPTCRTAAAILTPAHTVLRHRTRGAFTLHTTPDGRHPGRVLRPAPSAVVSAVHAWLSAQSTAAQEQAEAQAEARTEAQAQAQAPRIPAELLREIGPLTVRVHVREANAEELAREV